MTPIATAHPRVPVRSRRLSPDRGEETSDRHSEVRVVTPPWGVMLYYDT